MTNLATITTALNAKINEVKNKIPNITNLATTTALTGVENKIPNVSNLVKKPDHKTKICETENKIITDHDKYITTQEFNKLTANLASKSDIANFVKKADFDDKLQNLNKIVTSNKNELNELSEKVKAISTKGLTKDLINKFSVLNEKYFSSAIFQNYLLFIPAKKYTKYFSATTWIDSWKSNGMSEDIRKIELNQTAILHQLFLIMICYQT